MSELIGIKPKKVTVNDILNRHNDAKKIIQALVEIEYHLAKQLALSKSMENDREMHLANVAVLSAKRTEARRNFVVYVRRTIDMMATV